MNRVSSIKKASSVVSEILTLLEINTVVGSSGRKLENLASELMSRKRTKSSSFNYQGFPSKICVSVNHAVTHGIPNDFPFVVGDLVSFDVACSYRGYHADAARTVIVKPTLDSQKLPDDYQLREKIIDVTYGALIESIKTIIPNRTTNVDLGNFINSYVEERGFFVVEEYGGHGIGKQLHVEPFIPNFRNYDKQQGVQKSIIRTGMFICIEPIVQERNEKVTVSDDNWTVYSPSLSSHFEHTVYIGDDYVEILTLENPLRIQSLKIAKEQ